MEGAVFLRKPCFLTLTVCLSSCTSPIPATHEPCALVPSHVSLPLVPGRVSLLPSEQVAVWDIQPLFSPLPRHLLRLQISAPLSPPLTSSQVSLLSFVTSALCFSLAHEWNWLCK